ncbi:hypothetical protein M9458_037096, partial [Cirrhinus mrigala]
LPELRHVSSDLPEPRHVTLDHPEPHQVTSDRPEPRHVTSSRVTSHPICCNQFIKVSLRDAPLMSARSAGIPKPTHLTPPVLELITLSASLPMLGIAWWCVWAVYTTTEVAVFAAASSVAERLAAVSPEMAAEAAEPHKMGTSALAPCTVVAPSNTHPACGSSFCPVAAMEATYELSVHAVPVMEAMYELSAPPVTALEAITELSVLPVPAMEATYELSAHPIMAMEAVSELTAPSVKAKKAMYELSVPPVPVLEASYELKPAKEATHEPVHGCGTLSCPEPIYKLSTCSVPTETAIKPTAFPTSLLVSLSISSVSVLPRSQSLAWVSALSTLSRWSSAPLWWSAQAWSSPALSSPPWWAPALSAPPWWPSASTALLAPPCFPALLVLPLSPGPPHGPGLPTLASSRPCPTAHLDCLLFGASGSHSLVGGSVKKSCPVEKKWLG